MTIATWIALAGVITTLVINITKSASKRGAQDQKIDELRKRAEEDRVQMQKLDKRLDEEEKAHAVQVTQYENLRMDIHRIETAQEVQGTKMDKVMESLAVITEHIKHHEHS